MALLRGYSLLVNTSTTADELLGTLCVLLIFTLVVWVTSTVAMADGALAPPPGTKLEPADITFYCNEGANGCATCCGKWAPLNRTASGRRPVAGVSCAAPPGVPFGTWVHIEGVGYRRVDDRTATKYSHRWDVFVAGHKEALKKGILLKRRIVVSSKP